MEKVSCAGFGLERDLMLCEGDTLLLARSVWVREKVAVPWMLVTNLELEFILIRLNEEPFGDVEQHRKVPILLDLFRAHLNMTESPRGRPKLLLEV
jgi:hypothetical protein